MAVPPKKRTAASDAPSGIKKPRVSFDPSSKPTNRPEAKPSTAPRPAPSFPSSLQSDETDFPRGGGSSLTALEYKQVRDEGRREAEDEEKKAGVGQGVKRKRQVSTREAKRLEKNVVKQSTKEIEGYRVEHLNYKVSRIFQV
jgi:rRNA biogenesis protein RRP5